VQAIEEKMTDETSISNIYEFNDEFEVLMKICDLDSCDVRLRWWRRR